MSKKIPAYCPFGSSPFGEACGGRPCPPASLEAPGGRDASRPAEPPEESIADLVRLLSRSRPSYRRADLCLWSK